MTESYRLDQIVTRAGDQGETSLADGVKLSKSSLHIQALGDVDELNSVLGLVVVALHEDALTKSNLAKASLHLVLQQIQNDLFDLGAELAMPGYLVLTSSHILKLDECIAKWRDALPPLKEFILPGGCKSASFAHQARSVCRRVERSLVALNQQTIVPPYGLQYLNRLSDALFLFARYCNLLAQVYEPVWQPSTKTNATSE